MANLYSLIESAEKIGMLQHPQEIQILSGFVAGLNPTNIMEIGSWKGGVFYILQGLIEKSGIAISLDLDCYGEVPIEARNLMFHSLGEHVKVLNSDSHSMITYDKVKEFLDGKKLDFLLIDGDHSYDGVKQDYFMYSTLVRRGGWIALHDINDTAFHLSKGCEVSRFWKELQGNKIEISIGEDWGGIGLIQHEYN